jgi:hypothetical protein
MVHLGTLRIDTEFGAEDKNQRGRKRCQDCFVENLNPPHNHQIVGDDFQEQRSVLSVVGLGVQRFAEPSLQHADDRFDLPSLAVATSFGGSAEVGAHLSAKS